MVSLNTQILIHIGLYNVNSNKKVFKKWISLNGVGVDNIDKFANSLLFSLNKINC